MFFSFRRRAKPSLSCQQPVWQLDRPRDRCHMAKRSSLKGSQGPWSPATQVLPRLRSFSLHSPGFFMCPMSLHLPLGLIPWLRFPHRPQVCLCNPRSPHLPSPHRCPDFMVQDYLTILRSFQLHSGDLPCSVACVQESYLLSFGTLVRDLLHGNAVQGSRFSALSSDLHLRTAFSLKNKLGWGTRCPGMLEQHLLLRYIIPACCFESRQTFSILIVYHICEGFQGTKKRARH